MFILSRNRKEKIVTAGTLIACCLLLILSIRLALAGRYALMISLLVALISVAIFKGLKIGYILGRCLFGGTAILLIGGGALNPFTYEDIHVAGVSYGYFLIENILLIVVAIFLFYCLGEHARLRKSK
jgi:hypothetical protein